MVDNKTIDNMDVKPLDDDDYFEWKFKKNVHLRVWIDEGGVAIISLVGRVLQMWNSKTDIIWLYFVWIWVYA